MFLSQAVYVLKPLQVRQEKLSGIYRCQIVGRIVTEHLIGGIVEQELREGVQFDANNGYKMATGD